VDKIEFFGNFPRNVFCAFAVTLLARPEQLDVDDHGCFASPSCGDQSVAGRKVVLIGFLAIFIADPISHQVTFLCHTTHPSRQQTVTAGFYMRRVPPPTRYQVGTRLLQAGSSPVSHAGSETKKSSAAFIAPPTAYLLPDSPS